MDPKTARILSNIAIQKTTIRTQELLPRFIKINDEEIERNANEGFVSSTIIVNSSKTPAGLTDLDRRLLLESLTAHYRGKGFRVKDNGLTTVIYWRGSDCD